MSVDFICIEKRKNSSSTNVRRFSVINNVFNVVHDILRENDLHSTVLKINIILSLNEMEIVQNLIHIRNQN